MAPSRNERPLARSIPLGPGREFDLIRELVARWGPLAEGIGDDAAILPPVEGSVVLSTDTSVEGVHFRRDWLSPREIGLRAAAAALSDLAAMAAEPVGVLLALSIPERWLRDVGDLADGVADAVGEADTRILGGDVTRAAELAICVTVVGSAAAPLTRAGARPGDAVYVTGALGGPLSAVRAWQRGDRPAAAHRERFAHPRPRIQEARWLAAHGARAAVDISDGLVADLAHVARASGVRIVLEAERIPRVDGVGWREAAASGEEYEVAVTAGDPLDAPEFAERFGMPLTAIGRVRAGEPGVEVTLAGERVAAPGGWDHFS
jgi:thiamine-monophosphate kinase